ncbi:OmpH family outer membrane protein [Hufsiella ginkgonis]|uniref:OmpH family outer membrane protein n=1 Tax=Hufsiella ginkgonis TaxID=2695274 RepID=A0A7K1Y3B3_9SPHI|nr:OmpH family outer membrane protein [Hufsiella ginkgonis]MXV17783.1 OmpH family outer membrane protein [Hufsiella ginkgonis]
MKNLIKVGVVAAGLFLGINKGNAQQKFAHINSAELLAAMPEIKTADANYQTFYKQKQTQLETMDGERVKKVTTYQEKAKTRSQANAESIDKELATLANEIQDLEKRIQDASTKADEELKKKREELYQPVYDKAQDAIKAVAKEKGFAYVFDTQQQSLLYFDGGEDIIASVKTKLGIAATPSTATVPSAKKP